MSVIKLECVEEAWGFTLGNIYEMDVENKIFRDDDGDNRRSFVACKATRDENFREVGDLEAFMITDFKQFFAHRAASPESVETPVEAEPARTISNITAERGERYGSVEEHFGATEQMFDIWLRRREISKSCNGDMERRAEHVLRHIVFMVIDKLVRLANDASHQDNYDDIQGYASLWKGYAERYPHEVKKTEPVF